jgi:conjugal transfer pilus assembly protein TraL
MMRDDDKYYIPKAIDEPFRIYLLTLDEFLLLTLPILIIGFVFHQMVLGFMVGISAMWSIKKFKGEQGHYYIAHLAYWYLPPIVRFKATPPSYIRDYIG